VDIAALPSILLEALRNHAVDLDRAAARGGATGRAVSVTYASTAIKASGRHIGQFTMLF